MLRNYARETGLKLVAGIDEVGWGAFAGPVVTAAVILPSDFESDLIVDSKLICKSANKMQAAYDVIMNNAISVSCSAIQAKTINELGPQPSLDLSIQQSIDGLGIDPDMLLVDGNRYKPHRPDLRYELVEKGDNTFLCIAAASIVAKYRRDAYMVKIHEQFPMYGFSSSKGYGSPKHYEGLKEYGRCQYHRNKYVESWAKNQGLIIM
jgi:ribonuclease HII